MPPEKCNVQSFWTASGFTLAELLVTLLILGQIATFTIPKVLQSQQDSRFKAIAKEAAGMVSEAYSIYRAKNTVDANFRFYYMTPYLNYVSVDMTTDIDRGQGVAGALNCGAQPIYACLVLHNGARLFYADEPFSGTATTNAIYFYVDPDGKYSGSPTGAGKSIVFWLYPNGRLVTWKDMLPGTICDSTPYSADPSKDPPWFSW